MRTAFVDTLLRVARERPDIVLLTADLGFSVLERFRDALPRQFVNVGVAEQNMIGIAAGLAHLGKTVFVYSIANFPTLRCLEHVRNAWDPALRLFPAHYQLDSERSATRVVEGRLGALAPENPPFAIRDADAVITAENCR